MVEVGKRARLGVGSQVLLEPSDHRGGSPTPAHVLAHGVERDEVPPSQVVGVVALGWVARRCAEVVVITGGTGRLVLVVTHGGLSARLEAPPRRFVAVGELGGRTVLVDVVSER